MIFGEDGETVVFKYTQYKSEDGNYNPEEEQFVDWLAAHRGMLRNKSEKQLRKLYEADKKHT